MPAEISKVVVPNRGVAEALGGIYNAQGYHELIGFAV